MSSSNSVETICHENSFNNCYQTFLNIASGSILNFSLEFFLKDVYNQTCFSVNNEVISIDFVKEKEILESFNINKSQNFQNFQGMTTLTLSKGKASFKSLQIFADPNSQVLFKVTTSSIKTSDENSSNNLSSNVIINGTYSYVFSIKFRKCQKGELYLTKINSCSKCPIGKYSLVDPHVGNTSNYVDCKNCPLSASCPGGDIIVLNQGYWRNSTNSDNILDCESFSDFCLGGYDSICKYGHSGPLCGDCMKGFSKIGEECVSCMATSSIAIQIIGIFALLFYVIFILLYIRFAIKESEKNNKRLQSCVGNGIYQIKVEKGKDGITISTYIKILINYSQMIGIIKSLQLKWPYYVSNFFNVVLNFGFISTGIINIDCILSELQINTPAIYMKVQFTLYFYIAFVILGILFYSIRYFFFKKKDQYKRFLMFLLVFSVMIQPNSVQEGTNLLICQKIEGKSYLANQISEECYSPYHLFWVFYFDIPVLFFWIFVYPLICLSYLILHKSLINTSELRLKMGYYLDGYSNKYFYWEFIIMYRKMAFIFISILPMLGNIQKSLIILMFSAISYIVDFKHKPFVWEPLNQMEEKSNSAAFITIFGGCLYVLSISDYLKAIAFLIILMINLRFLLNWFSTVINIYARLYAPKLFKICPKLMQFLQTSSTALHSLARAVSPKKRNIPFSKNQKAI